MRQEGYISLYSSPSYSVEVRREDVQRVRQLAHDVTHDPQGLPELQDRVSAWTNSTLLLALVHQGLVSHAEDVGRKEPLDAVQLAAFIIRET
jgi:hypothetical protein